MKIISWNVNGIRAIMKKDFLIFLKNEAPDILCLQEVKISDEALSKISLDFPGYKEYWHLAKRPGYSGTAILVKDDFEEKYQEYQVKEGLGNDLFDNEGRAQIAEFKDFYLINAYFPNANSQLSRLNYKMEFNEELFKKVKALEKKKAVVVTGDFNVAHQEIDLARPKENVGSPGFTPQERSFMDKFIDSGMVDSFRYLHPQEIKYSWWSFRTFARKRNIGWRIDYFCTSKNMIKKIKQADILDKQLGSDHAPVLLEIK